MGFSFGDSKKGKGFRRPVSYYVRGFVYLGLVVVVQFALVGLVYLESGEKVLYSGLDSDDIAEISEFLKQQGVSYRISDAGTSVLIHGDVEDLQKKYDAWEWDRKKTQQNEKLNAEGSAGAEVNPDPRRFNAIRKELEKLLSTGSEQIAWARVGFPHEEKEALQEGEGKKGAAVFLGTGGKTLPSVDVQRIQWVVANSFAGLKPADVRVQDEVGRELTHPAQD